MASSRVSATLVAVVVISVFGAAQGKQCSGNFCKRWMCEQNNNRKCNLAKALDNTLTDADCESLKGSEPFASELARCNNVQRDTAVDSCDPYGNIGILYDRSTCDNPNPANTSYVPYQLPADSNQRVYVETTALGVVADDRIADATTAVAGGCTDGVPNVGNGAYNDFTCICTASNPAQEQACVDELVAAFKTTPNFQQQYAEVFVDVAGPLFVSMGVLPPDATAEEQRDAARRSPQLGLQSQFAGNDLYIPPEPESATPSRRRRLRERNLANRMLRAPITGA